MMWFDEGVGGIGCRWQVCDLRDLEVAPGCTDRSARKPICLHDRPG